MLTYTFNKQYLTFKGFNRERRVVDGHSVSANEVLDKSSVVPAGSVIKLSVKGTGSYAGGEIYQTYRIIEKNVDINKAKVSVRPQQYTGKAVTITSMTQFANDSITLKASGSNHNLVLGRDFVIVEDSYVNNVKRGTAKVTIQGIGTYGGQKTISFKIGQRTINDFWTGLVNLFNII